MRTATHRSGNGKFIVEITGQYYEDFPPDNSIFSFYRKDTKELLWEKNDMNTSFPAISNLGDFAAPQKTRIVFYEQGGTIKATFSDPAHDFSAFGAYGNSTCHEYAASGTAYYFFTQYTGTDETVLWCLDERGNMQWQMDLEHYIPLKIFPLTSDRILIYGFFQGA